MRKKGYEDYLKREGIGDVERDNMYGSHFRARDAAIVIESKEEMKELENFDKGVRARMGLGKIHDDFYKDPPDNIIDFDEFKKSKDK